MQRIHEALKNSGNYGKIRYGEDFNEFFAEAYMLYGVDELAISDIDDKLKISPGLRNVLDSIFGEGNARI